MRFLVELAFTTVTPFTVDAESEAELRKLIEEGGSSNPLFLQPDGDPRPQPPQLQRVKPLEE
ncbi:hypothetical protein SAMN05216212_2532 [Microbulbifer yueqingensis]|uniref:Uncharacterized protein n=1 Tax=Microbulbifer yueqingensis TaxID=658219 RepID=A0A1G9CJG4_9GAMM|nr:hypothetical protein SAMN05216212_2532 [Microbulbifer yueqingensis]